MLQNKHDNIIDSTTFSMSLKLLSVVYLATILLVTESVLICDNTAIDTSSSSVLYILRDGSQYCYRYFNSKDTFRGAEGVCENDNAVLLRIDTQEENDYINSTFFDNSEFWLGLSDVDSEGIFKWSDNEDLGVNSYQSWVDGTPLSSNRNSFDCVKFTRQGWIVHNDFCESSTLPFVCRQLACNSSDSISCDIPSVESTDGLSAAIIAVIIVVTVVVLLVVGIAVFLLIMWKFQNDIFNKYICFCSLGNSKATINTLQQEVQRLQTELSQQKLNSSGRFSQLGRQSSQVSIKPMPIMNRSFSTSKVVPMSMISAPSQPRPSIISRGNSVSLMKPPLLSPVSEEKPN